MKKIVVITFLLLGQISISQTWKTNFEEAKKQAIAENKNILLVFSGSDWCGPCIKLDKNIWQSNEFKKEADKSWVLLKADFPKKKANQLPAEVTENNNKLAEKYNKDGNFPLVVLLDKTGKVLGMTGYQKMDAAPFLENIHKFEK
ncbi:thioredoxin family protein [Flavobacterium branchiophilum]|uniref:Thiol-disulfide isomerase n=1 Tax=Flavobacterium branchiophilum TaxID=55197 RepID=A0A2H3KCB5_9FLAO|nr:thioredoxin family protein [Flavobacterium branchiophilum]PDS24942.1 thiol-disulfide isomerase [Flavobacterium branchiophilum]